MWHCRRGMKELDIVLERATKPHGAAERRALAARKNEYFGELIQRLSIEGLPSKRTFGAEIGQ